MRLGLPRRSAFGFIAVLTLPWSPEPAAPEDRCLTETAITGAYVSPCMLEDSREFSWPSVGKVSIAQGKVGPGSTGAAVWTAGTALATFLTTLDGVQALRGKRVIELGCGTGLCGIVAARLGASQVLLTDGNADLLERTRDNVRHNMEQLHPTIDVEPLQWGGSTWTSRCVAPEVVLASDVLYQSAWRPLAGACESC